MSENFGWLESEVPDYHYHMKPVEIPDAHFAIGLGYTHPDYPGLYLIHGSNVHEREGLNKNNWYVVNNISGPESEHDSMKHANDYLENDSKNKIEVHITVREYVEEENPDPNNELHNFNYEVKNMSLLEIKRHLESILSIVEKITALLALSSLHFVRYSIA